MHVLLHESEELYEREYQLVRATLVAKGSSLNEYLQSQGINRQLAYKALKGQSFGPKARELRRRILLDVLSRDMVAA